MPKVKQLSEIIRERNLPIEIEIDGGINEETIIPCVEAGATIFVAGSAIYNQTDRAAALQAYKGCWRKCTTKMKYAVVCAGGPIAEIAGSYGVS